MLRDPQRTIWPWHGFLTPAALGPSYVTLARAKLRPGNTFTAGNCLPDNATTLAETDNSVGIHELACPIPPAYRARILVALQSDAPDQP